MDKESLKKYYCSYCDDYFDAPCSFYEDRSPYGEKGNSSWQEELEGCPQCQGGMDIVYLCPRCETFKKTIEYYPYAEEYMCDDCYEEMMENGELVEEAMEGVIENEEPRGLPE